MLTQRTIVKKCSICVRKFHMNSSVLLAHSVLYHHIGFLSGYLMILTSNIYYKYHIVYCQKTGVARYSP